MTNRAGELDEAADIFLSELLHVQTGENLLIYVDDGSDQKVCSAIQQRTHARSASATIVRLDKAQPLALQSQQLVACLQSASYHAICELSDQYFYQTPAWPAARDAGARIFSVGGLDAAAFTRCIAQADHGRMFEFGTRLQTILQGAAQLRLITATFACASSTMDDEIS